MSQGVHHPATQTRRYLVRGHVQGVGYRWFVQRYAQRAGLSGWVRNLSDGRVELLVHGPVAALLELGEALGRGPPGARVEAVECAGIDEDGIVPAIVSFEIR
jgi:acylphosphatase